MSQTSTDDAAWLRRYRPVPSPAARLVCLPYAGGSAPYFRPVALALDPAVDVVAVQYPGRQDRRQEAPISDMNELADRVAEILDRQPALPLTLFGHSMGAVLAFEVARRLEAEGRGPAHVFVSGRRGPSTHRDETVHLRDDRGIMDELRATEGTAAAILNDEEMMRAALPALRADYLATESYRCAPGVAIEAPITALTGDRDPKTTLDECRAWAGHTLGGFELQVYSGGHFFLADNGPEINGMLDRHFAAGRVRERV
jgi:surfactin synthase thioesterase subunit